MKEGALGSRSSSGLPGLRGVCRAGVGRSIEKFESARPSMGCVGIVPLCVLRVRLVSNPEKFISEDVICYFTGGLTRGVL